jgi:hypothetical protein
MCLSDSSQAEHHATGIGVLTSADRPGSVDAVNSRWSLRGQLGGLGVMTAVMRLAPSAPGGHGWMASTCSRESHTRMGLGFGSPRVAGQGGCLPMTFGRNTSPVRVALRMKIVYAC